MTVKLVKEPCLIAFIAALLLISPFADADKLYVGFGLSQLNYQRDNVQRAISPDGDPAVFDTRLCGYRADGDYSSCINADNGRVGQTFDADIDMDMFSIKIGYQFASNFSMEFRGGIGTSEPEVDRFTEITYAYTGQSTGGGGQQLTTFISEPTVSTMKANRIFGIYARLGGAKESSIRYVDPLSSNKLIVSPYLLFGFDSVKYTTGVSGGGLEGHSDGFAKGVGLNIYLNDSLPFAINFEMMQHKDEKYKNSVINQEYFKFGIDFLF